VGHSIGDVGGIPEHDRGDDEVKAGGTKLLRLGAAVGDPALLESADDLRERMTLLALVKSGMAAPAQFWAFEPVEHEQRAFDPPQLLQRQVELVLAAIGREFPEHGGWRHDAGLQRRDQANYLAPMLPDDVGLDALAEKRLKIRVGCGRRNASELPLGQVAQARAKSKAEQGAEDDFEEERHGTRSLDTG